MLAQLLLNTVLLRSNQQQSKTHEIVSLEVFSTESLKKAWFC